MAPIVPSTGPNTSFDRASALGSVPHVDDGPLAGAASKPSGAAGKDLNDPDFRFDEGNEETEPTFSFDEEPDEDTGAAVFTFEVDPEIDDGRPTADAVPDAAAQGKGVPPTPTGWTNPYEGGISEGELAEDDDPNPDQLVWPDETPGNKAAATGGAAETAGAKSWDTPKATDVLDIEGLGASDEDEDVLHLDAELFEEAAVAGREEAEDAPFVWAPPQQAEQTVTEKGKGTRMVVVILVALVLICTFAGVYVLMIQSCEGKYLPRTTINGLDVSGLTREEALSALEAETDEYGIEVRVGNYAGAFMGRHIGLSRDEAKMIEETWPEVDARLWLPHLISPQEFVVDDGIDFNEPVLRDVVMRSVDDHNNMALPHDQAQITLDEASGTYVLSGTTSGTAVDKHAVADAAVEDVRAFKTNSNPDPEACLHEATVTDLPAYAYAVVRANLCRTNAVPILVAGQQVDELTIDQERAWVTIDDEPKVVVDEAALRQWAEDVVVYSAWHQDDWTSYSLDVDAFVAGLVGRLSLGIVEGYEVPVVDELKREGESREYAYQRGGWNPELGRYIDVDLEAQFVRLFDETGNVIWESACVSGDVYEDRSTVVGQFEIYAKQTNTTLVGLDYDNDGNPDYESFVNYWMPFYGGYGLHDATWRSTFGGDLYYYDGSHGCINLPFAKARELFDITFVGEKVNVHY